MTEKRPQNDQQPTPETEIEIEAPQGAEVEVETEAPEGTNDFKTDSVVQAPEKKDARGGNHNPKGANQYTRGRVDDRGGKK